jgi:predicted PurR-regulated permease PerM
LKLIFWIILAAVAGVGVCLALGFLGYSPFNKLSDLVAGWFSKFDLAGIISNPASLITIAITGISGIAGIVTLYSKVNEAKNQAQQALTQQASKYQGALSEVTGQLDNATNSIDGLSAAKTAAEKQVGDLQTKLSNTEPLIQSLTNQNQLLMEKLENTPVKIVETVK